LTNVTKIRIFRIDSSVVSEVGCRTLPYELTLHNGTMDKAADDQVT